MRKRKTKALRCWLSAIRDSHTDIGHARMVLHGAAVRLRERIVSRGESHASIAGMFEMVELAGAHVRALRAYHRSVVVGSPVSYPRSPASGSDHAALARANREADSLLALWRQTDSRTTLRAYAESNSVLRSAMLVHGGR